MTFLFIIDCNLCEYDKLYINNYINRLPIITDNVILKQYFNHHKIFQKETIVKEYMTKYNLKDYLYDNSNSSISYSEYISLYYTVHELCTDYEMRIDVYKYMNKHFRSIITDNKDNFLLGYPFLKDTNFKFEYDKDLCSQYYHLFMLKDIRIFVTHKYCEQYYNSYFKNSINVYFHGFDIKQITDNILKAYNEIYYASYIFSNNILRDITTKTNINIKDYIENNYLETNIGKINSKYISSSPSKYLVIMKTNILMSLSSYSIGNKNIYKNYKDIHVDIKRDVFTKFSGCYQFSEEMFDNFVMYANKDCKEIYCYNSPDYAKILSEPGLFSIEYPFYKGTNLDILNIIKNKSILDTDFLCIDYDHEKQLKKLLKQQDKNIKILYINIQNSEDDLYEIFYDNGWFGQEKYQKAFFNSLSFLRSLQLVLNEERLKEIYSKITDIRDLLDIEKLKKYSIDENNECEMINYDKFINYITNKYCSEQFLINYFDYKCILEDIKNNENSSWLDKEIVMNRNGKFKMITDFIIVNRNDLLTEFPFKNDLDMRIYD